MYCAIRIEHSLDDEDSDEIEVLLFKDEAQATAFVMNIPVHSSVSWRLQATDDRHLTS